MSAEARKQEKNKHGQILTSVLENGNDRELWGWRRELLFIATRMRKIIMTYVCHARERHTGDTRCAHARSFPVVGIQDLCVPQKVPRLRITPREKSACDSPK